MARVDLKYSRVYFVDGDIRTGAINNGAGYAGGSTTLVVDGFSAAITAGRRISIGGYEYVVSSTVGGATPTQILIPSPGLLASVLDNAVVTVLGNHVELKIGDGTLSWDERRNIEYQLDRGNLDTVREGDQVPLDLNVDMAYEYVTGTGSVLNPEDALKRINAASAWVSTDSDTCAPYAVDVKVIYDPTCSGADSTETLIFNDFRYESISHDIKASTIRCSGKCNATRVTATRI
jgi:hypothetical protein